MLDFTDYSEDRKRAVESAAAAQSEQRRLSRQVSVVMSEVKSDPRWKVYADHILAWRELCSAISKAASDKIADPRSFLSPEEYGKFKLEAAYSQGKAEGLDSALKVIEDLIDKGKEPEPLKEII